MYSSGGRSAASRPARRPARSSATTRMRMPSRNGHASRKLKSVPLKSRPVSAAASAPASRTGKNGRMPTAAASPAPWRRSRMKSMRGRVAPGGMTIDETPRDPGSGAESPGMARSRTTARDLERYAGLFARRTHGMRSSAMRDLMAITARPEIISLAGGLPDTTTFPAEDVAAIMARVAADASARALQYGPTEGMDELKECIVRVMAEEGMDVGTDELLVTTGGQQVIDLVCKTLVDPGDVIVAEGPTYPGAVPTFCAYEADVVQIEMDVDGMRIDVLEETLDRLQREGRTPKFIYTIPTFQNPGGVTMSLDRRRALVRIAAEQELVVLEDNPYGLLRYEGEPLPPLYALDRGEYVIYLATFSKILSPGLRLGWTAAPRPVLEKLNLAKQGTDLCSSTFGQHFVVEYFAQRDWRQLLGSLRGLYRRRRDTMLDALAEQFPR